MKVDPSPARLTALFPEGVLPAECPSRTVLDHVTSRWGVLVLVALADGELRWSELLRRVEGVSDKMLAQTLRLLQGDGFVAREVHPDSPPRVEYRLTARGDELVDRLLPLMTWIAEHAGEIVGAGDG